MEKLLGTKRIESYFEEDDLYRNAFYNQNLPKDLVECELKIKDDLLLSGLPFFIEVFENLSQEKFHEKKEFLFFEGQSFLKTDNIVLKFMLPFNVALNGERLALNLLQRSSAISTFTKKFVDLNTISTCRIIDTRKTTPGLRALEKYAVRVGGGLNHRFGQSDMWMIKDNHKTFFGGLEKAYIYFKSMGGAYTPILAEIHSLEELNQALELGIKHLMLDNFSADDITKALNVKKPNMTYEISGGVTLENFSEYLKEGIDFISIGSLTNNAPRVDLSLKMQRI